MTDKELISIVDTKAKKLWDEINTGHEYSIIESYNQFYGICMEIAEMLQEEPLSEDLKEIAWNHADKKCHLDIAIFTSDEVKKEREKMQFTWQDLYDAVMFGAKCQKQQMIKNTEAYNMGLVDGNAEALKDMPKWRKSKTEWDSNKEHYYKGYYIDLEELFDKLPKDE